MQIYDFLCHTVFLYIYRYPFSYLTPIFTRKDFVQLNHISSYPPVF